MPITLLNPDGLPQHDIYRQVAVATGTKLVFVAGQVARTAEGERVGEGDLAAQVEQCYENLATALAAAGASFDDVTKLTAYFVEWAPEKMSQWVEGVARASARLGITTAPPLTGIGVAALAEPDLLVEVEAVAVID
ncbi:RidA family protein [Mycolicibacterium confluentis]|uniref:Enamine deaminase RidA n=1 Tax=Mycolicibacterium confluentis TaxID=28047 RepID=A0A7I7Y4L2_9MYCO|nr:RidA family protein [Mycolicibacterium confluentis]MCV7318353.1 RidA family protein [Mycolicibacterium confluentis]ORV29659.1 enamine deaminase RidA [Mycolicibacterium confluentis]BBZ36264.1 enamine deaminase RidA [Mycolicibacterium confluentis]